jgi:ribosomal protein S18 acetylase RimI-like enzyme
MIADYNVRSVLGQQIVETLLESEDESAPRPGKRLFFQPEWDNGNISILTPSKNIVGQVWWRPTGRFTVEIEHLEIDACYQRQGLGEALLRRLVNQLPKLYPEVRFLTGSATSKGIIRLLQRVLGSSGHISGADRLPERSPNDWYKTTNRARVRFRLK